MRKLLGLAIIWLLFFSMFRQRSLAWSGGLHAEMASDALQGLQLPGGIGNIPEYAGQVDYVSPHPEYSCHRISIYQDEFERYGGDNCTLLGAEWYSTWHLVDAREAYEADNITEGQRHLGYAIHYIQDALCPPHVFPFLEGLTSPHTLFEIYSASNYNISDWPSLVRNAEPITITGPDDLRVKIVKVAGLMRAVTENYTSYTRQDGTEVGNPPLGGWNISDEHIGMWMEKAASLVKGAALWITSAPTSTSGHAWQMFQHDHQRTGRSPYIGPDSPELRVQTLFEVAESTYNGPIINVAIGLDGTIYFRGSAPGRGTGLFAIHSNGTEKWFLSFDTHATGGGHPTLGPDGTIYCQSSDGILAVNPNGTLRWQKAVATLYYRQHFATSDNGILYFVAGVVLPTGSGAPCMVALNADGTLVWVFEMKNETIWHLSPDYDLEQGWGTSGSDTDEVTSPSIGPDGTIYVGYRGTIWSFNSDGTKNWQRTLGPEGYRSFRGGGPVISSSGVIYVVSGVAWVSPYKLYGLSSEGNILWETNLGGGYMYGHPAIGPDGTLYVFHTPDRYPPLWNLTAIDTQGNQKWEVHIGGYGIPIVDAKGNIFTTSYSLGSHIVACFSSNGHLLWKLSFPGQLSSRTGLALDQEGTLFVPGVELYAIQARPHDTAITSVTASKTIVGEGYSLQINVSVKNEGDFHENLNVSAYANTTLIETQKMDNLPIGTSTVITFTWPKTCVAYGNYTIRVYAWPVQGEKDIFDNAYTDGTVLVKIAGDVNCDGTVDASDLSALYKAYGSTYQDPNCDINGDGKVDIEDLYTLSKNYGKNE